MRIVGDQGQPFGLSLGNQHTVEGVAVVEGQAGGQLGVAEGDMQLNKSVLLHRLFCLFQVRSRR